MAQAVVNFSMDAVLKEQMEQTCHAMGLTMASAFTMFAAKVTREQRIPFEVSADPFYSETNMERLRESIAQMEATGGTNDHLYSEQKGLSHLDHVRQPLFFHREISILVPKSSGFFSQKFCHALERLRRVEVTGQRVNFFSFEEDLHGLHLGELGQGVDDGADEHFLSRRASCKVLDEVFAEIDGRNAVLDCDALELRLLGDDRDDALRLRAREQGFHRRLVLAVLRRLDRARLGDELHAVVVGIIDLDADLLRLLGRVLLRSRILRVRNRRLVRSRSAAALRLVICITARDKEKRQKHEEREHGFHDFHSKKPPFYSLIRPQRSGSAPSLWQMPSCFENPPRSRGLLLAHSR